MTEIPASSTMLSDSAPAASGPAAHRPSLTEQDRPLLGNWLMLGLLFGGQLRMWRNTLLQAVRLTPVRSATIAVSMLVVWYGVYVVFLETFRRLNLQETYGGHAIHFLLLLFFTTLTVMLFFSNAIILYSGLTRSREMDFLLASPTPPAAIFTYKYVESMAYASWALLLLALPLVTAFTVAGGLPLWFLPLFLLFLLTFIPIPAAAGAMAALLVGRLAPRKPLRWLIAGGVILGAGVIAAAVWVIRAGGRGVLVNPWTTMDRIFDRLAIMDSPVMPGYWMTQGLEAAGNLRFAEAGFYYLVTATNAVFLNTWAIVLGTATLQSMVSAVSSRSGRARAPSPWLDRGVSVLLFWLPGSWQRLIAKDLRLFVRDPAQWSQCLIFLMLLALYMFNVPRLSEYVPAVSETGQSGLNRGQFLLAGMLTVAAGLITAVFTSRFVFPMLSLEGRRIWAIGTAPIGRGAMVYAKFCYSLILCGGVAVALVMMGGLRLKLPAEAVLFGAFTALCMCTGLSAVAVGSGARWPDFQEDNAAKIAGGFGGTVNLLLSLAFLFGLVLPPAVVMGEGLIRSFVDRVATEATTAGGPDWLLLSIAAYMAALTGAVSALALRVAVRCVESWEP